MADPWLSVTMRLAQQTARIVTAIQDSAGLSPDEKVALQAAAIARAQRQVTGFNDALLNAELYKLLGKQVPILGLEWYETAEEQTARLSKAVASTVADDVAYVAEEADIDRRDVLRAVSLAERLVRLSESEVAQGSQWARGEGMIRHKVRGWYRRVNPAACDFCTMIAGTTDAKGNLTGSKASDFIHPAGHRMATHPHCFCSQAIVNEIGPGQKWLGKRTKMGELIHD